MKQILKNQLNVESTIDIYEIDNIQILNSKKNIEHLVPKHLQKLVHSRDIRSKFTNDLHLIRYVNSYVNNWRSNYKFTEINYLNVNTVIYNNISSIQNINIENLTIKDKLKKTFQPPPHSRGIIARSCAYFLTTYSQYKSFFDNIIDPMTVLKWNLEYPVNEDEYHRNFIIYSLQGNLNIYIQNPDLVDSLIEEHLKLKLPDKEKTQRLKKYQSQQYNLYSQLSLYWE